MNEESEAVKENSSNTAPEAHDHAQSQTVETQQVSAGSTASCSGDDNLMCHIQEGQWSAISVMCTNLYIPTRRKKTEDVTTHHKFIKVLADLAVSANEYFGLSMVWKGHQSFVKPGARRPQLVF